MNPRRAVRRPARAGAPGPRAPASRPRPAPIGGPAVSTSGAPVRPPPRTDRSRRGPPTSPASRARSRRDVAHVVVRRRAPRGARVSLPGDDDRAQAGDPARTPPAASRRPRRTGPPRSRATSGTASRFVPPRNSATSSPNASTIAAAVAGTGVASGTTTIAAPGGERGRHDLDRATTLVLGRRPKDGWFEAAAAGRGQEPRAAAVGPRAPRGSAAARHGPGRSPIHPLFRGHAGRREPPDHGRERRDVPLAHPAREPQQLHVEDRHRRDSLLDGEHPRRDVVGRAEHPAPDGSPWNGTWTREPTPAPSSAGSS